MVQKLMKMKNDVFENDRNNVHKKAKIDEEYAKITKLGTTYSYL